jgi:hypothetical protein
MEIDVEERFCYLITSGIKKIGKGKCASTGDAGVRHATVL